MRLIREYRDESRDSKYDRKRAVIACERCGEEKDVRFTYVNDCIKNNRKYCKSCKMRVGAEEFMQEHNSQEPLSKCLRLIDNNGKLQGEFECSKCGSVRIRNHGEKPYNQLCMSCSNPTRGRVKHEVRHNTRLARIYRNMKARCYNENYDSYRYYGAKGVTICDEWLKDRTKFYDWALANGYTDEKQIDKDKKSAEFGINPPIYSPETCEWMTRDENDLYRAPQTNTGLHGISHYEDGQFRLRKTNAYPNTTEGYYYSLDQAIEARGPKLN